MSPRFTFQVIGLALCMLCVSRPALALDDWSPENPLHAELLRAYAQDPDVFPTSSGVVRQSLASAESLARFLGRNGVQVDKSTAELLVLHAELVMKGRNPRDVEAQRLVTAFKPGSRGLHGHLAEIDLAKANPELRFSSDGSQSTDLTVRGSDGTVLAYGQSKCSESAEKSLKGVIEDYICFHRKDWPGKSSVPYKGWIPKDQFEQLRREGMIDAEGRFSDRTAVDRRVRKVMEDISGYGPQNRAALEAGASRLSLGEDARSPLRIQPLPEARDTYLQRASAQNREYSSAKALRAVATPRTIFARGAAALGIAAFDVSNTRSPADLGVSASASALSVAEQFTTIDGAQKAQALQTLRALPRWMRPALPNVSSMRATGRWAGRIGVGVAVALAVWDVYQYSGGEMSTRQFSSSMSQMAGAIAGGWIGAESGALIGASVGSVIPGLGTAIGASIGSIVGAFAGAWTGSAVCGKANDAVWAVFDEQELEVALELIRARCRGLDP